MNYLTRPIFPFAIDWADPVNKAYSYDLAELQLGFGAEVFTGLQDHTVQGYQITVDLVSNGEIRLFNDFTTDLMGRLTGFWLPAPFEAMSVAAVVSPTVFDIPDQGLAATWQDHPDTYLLAIRPGSLAPTGGEGWGEGAVPTQITSVVNLGTGFERVTVSDPVPFLAARTIIRRLHYVRLADDAESGKFQRENWLRRTIKVIELPSEYAAIEQGLQKVYLYRFWFEQPMGIEWRYTSFAADVISGNKLWLASSISHGELKSTLAADAETLDIDAAYDVDHPFALFYPIPPGRPLKVEVSEADYADLAGVALGENGAMLGEAGHALGDPMLAPDPEVIFRGQVRTLPDKGDRLTANCDSVQAILKRKHPRMMIQPGCNYQVFDPRTCKVLRAFYETTAVIESVDNTALPPTITVSLLFSSAARIAARYFDQGWIEWGRQSTFSIRTIIGSAYDADLAQWTLQLNAPLYGAAAAQNIQLIPGCNGSFATCRDKFNNKTNFGGFVAVPEQNLSLQAVDRSVTQGGKK